MRRAPAIINVGEARDYSSMNGCIAASIQGHTDGTRRFAVREFLVFDEDVRDRFLDKPIDAWSAVVRGLLKEGMSSDKVIARPLAVSVMQLVEQGKITLSEARAFIPRSAFDVLD
ncbi:hypothetical protein ECB98_25330 [Brucellaceae bacterium VT-16-1752]|nr:hypothetical protein ECB98_25330 [Brucellaceae bacterium VT-16-1752]